MISLLNLSVELFWGRFKNPYVICAICVMAVAAVLFLCANLISNKIATKKNNQKNYSLVVKFVAMVLVLISLILIIVMV